MSWIFWCSIVLSIAYFLFEKCIQTLLKSRGGCQPWKWRPTALLSWNICYYLASTTFLVYFHMYFIQPELDREKENGRYFPQYENLLFYLSSNCRLNNFKSIFVVSISFHLLGTLFHLQQADYTATVTRILYTSVLTIFYNLRYEHYFVILNIILGIYEGLSHSLFLIALHTKRSNSFVFNVCAALYFLSWSYIFLTLLPFNYLLPTLYMKPFNVWLNVFGWMWYGSCVWNSPILQVLYHQTFHTMNTDCLGEGSVARCILLKETKDTRHLKWLRKTVEELKEAQSRSHPVSNGAENQSAKALQTLKCVMTLKRKLKRMREAKAAAAAAVTTTVEQDATTRDSDDDVKDVGNELNGGGGGGVAASACGGAHGTSSSSSFNGKVMGRTAGGGDEEEKGRNGTASPPLKLN